MLQMRKQSYKCEILRPAHGGAQNDIFQQAQQVYGSLRITQTPPSAEAEENIARPER